MIARIARRARRGRAPHFLGGARGRGSGGEGSAAAGTAARIPSRGGRWRTIFVLGRLQGRAQYEWEGAGVTDGFEPQIAAIFAEEETYDADED